VHLEVLVEDQSGKRLLEIILPEIVGPDHTFRVFCYKGIGRLPTGLNASADPRSRILLAQLPRLLAGYGTTFSHYPDGTKGAVVVVCDLDSRCLSSFRKELLALLNSCDPKPVTIFCFAIEEGEAWLLGDLPAVKSAYDKAKIPVLHGYKSDSVCGTWECLADAVFPGGSHALRAQGWQAIGKEKSIWAAKIGEKMNVESNSSPSFNYLRDKIRSLLS
jgi:hypothetical protein